MKKIYPILFSCLSLLLLSSCENWLEVSPASEVEADELFATQNGYNDALVGVYLAMNQKELYGDYLTLSQLDVMAQQYRTDKSKVSFPLAELDFSAHYSESIADAIWNTMYNALVNTNTIIGHINEESGSEKFSEGMHDLILGESLAVRALMHFDLLRLFHAPYLSNPEDQKMPYADVVSREALPRLTSNQVLERVLEDLTQAYTLLKEVDPLFYEEEVDNNFLLNRAHRLNYYAVAGLLARVNLYKGDYTEALKFAMEVIDSEEYRFIESHEIAQTHDNTFTCEHIFAVYSSNLGETYNEVFNDGDKFFISKFVENVFADEESHDLRWKNWIYIYSGNEGDRDFAVSKYNGSMIEEVIVEDPAIPIIRLPEMYLIAAECNVMMDGANLGEPIRLMNFIRTARESADELPDDIDLNGFFLELTKEYQREFLAEGQLFYFYKRLNFSAIPAYDGNLLPMHDDMYTLPVPKTELQYGGS